MEVNGRTYCPQDIAQLEAEAKENEGQIRNDMRETRILKAENAKLKALLKNAVAREKEANRGWSTAARERDAFRVAAKDVVDAKNKRCGGLPLPILVPIDALAALLGDKNE